jgi:hypothetical protein
MVIIGASYEEVALLEWMPRASYKSIWLGFSSGERLSQLSKSSPGLHEVDHAKTAFTLISKSWPHVSISIIQANRFNSGLAVNSES